MVRFLAGCMVAVMAAVGVAGCGSDSDGSVSAHDKPSETTTTGNPGPGNEADYVGLTKKAAIAKAEADGRPWRVTREDGESFPATLDYNPDRVNFEIDNGKVTSATFG